MCIEAYSYLILFILCYKISGSDSSVAEDSGLVGCCTMLLGLDCSAF